MTVLTGKGILIKHLREINNKYQEALKTRAAKIREVEQLDAQIKFFENQIEKIESDIVILNTEHPSSD